MSQDKPTLGMSMFASKEDYLEAALAAAQEEADSLRADAERYRWFADVATAGNVEALETTFACFQGLDPTRGHLDTAIDVAISAAKRKQP